MRKLPLAIGKIHFVGIGGIGMSGIAEILHNLGYKVQGSDIKQNANTDRLEHMGVEIFIGHDGTHVEEAEVLVISSAVKEDNVEVKAARKNMIPVIARADMLAEIMRLKWSIAVGGTHGKTTTTSLIAHVMDAAEFDPTVINGGIINAYGTNARLGQGEWMVVESDESDGSFVKLPSTIAIVTNIDPEHLDFYGSFEELEKAFQTFVNNIPFYGYAVLCSDHPNVQKLIPKVSEKKLLTYGFNPQADIRGDITAQEPDGVTFDIYLSSRITDSGKEEKISNVKIAMLGKHNVLNALAAFGATFSIGIKSEITRTALGTFTGVKRRFTLIDDLDGIRIYDDYAHHPTEITAVLSAARQVCRGKIIAVFQPHRYSRVHDLFKEFCTSFNDADCVLVSNIYPAGEKPIDGVDQNAIVTNLREYGHKDVRKLLSERDLPQMISEIAAPGDFVICLGAGDVTSWAHNLPQQLTPLLPKKPKLVKK